MKTEFAKAIEAGENVVGKEVVLLPQTNYYYLTAGKVYCVVNVSEMFIYFYNNPVCVNTGSANDFEFKHILDKQENEENKRLKEQLEGVIEVNKQYEQQLKQCRDDLFNLRMDNARLELDALRWSVFDCPVNRDIADKLLNKLADEAQGE